MTVYFLTPKLIDPSLHKASGGTISNLRLMEEISEYEKVICIPMITAGTPSSLEKNKNIIMEVSGNYNLGRFRYAVERYISYRPRVVKAINRHGKGVLVCTRATITLANDLSSQMGLPLVVLTRAFEDLEQAGLKPPSDRQSAFRRVEGLMQRKKIIAAYQDADLVVTNSEYMMKETGRLFDTKSPFQIVYPPMDLPQGIPVVDSIKKIGFVNKGSRKGKKLIVELARLFPKKIFLIFGEAIDQGDSKAVENLENVGYINDRVDLFGMADLFLVPSVWEEPYGRVAAEAIWRGKPVIVSKRGGLPEAAPNELFWEEDADPERWKNKIDLMEKIENRQSVKEAIKDAQYIIEAREGVGLKSWFASLSHAI